MPLVDLSHVIAAGTVTYPGLPAPLVTDFLSRDASREHYEAGTTFQIARIEMVANTGTYVDAPFHRYEEGADLAGLPLERLADVEGIVIDLAGTRSLPASALTGVEFAGRAVLIRTGWSLHFGTPAYGGGEHPFVSRDAAAALAAGGAAIVGIDSLNIDDTTDGGRPAHSLLLAAGIPVVEHLNRLDQLPVSGFRFFAVPAPFRHVGTFPVRAFAIT